MISALNKLPNGNLELTVTIPWLRVKKAYDTALGVLAKEAEVKGFRKGKAPAKLVAEKVGQKTLFEQALKDLLPDVYSEAIKEHQLKPIINPQIKVLKTEENKDWQVQFLTCEAPQAKLGDYQAEIKKVLAADKIWVPGKDKEEKKDPETQQKKIDKVLEVLLKTSQIQVPQILLDQEVDRHLAQLVNQTNQLGLTVERYLQTQGKTSEQLKKEYQDQAEKTLKLELVLSQIAEKEKIEVPEAEIEKMIDTVKDEKEKKRLDTPEQRAYLHQLLKKSRVIDKLTSL